MDADIEIAERILLSLTQRTKAYLESELKLSVTAESTTAPVACRKLALKDVTAISSLGGEANLMVLFTIDAALMALIFKNYTQDLTFSDDERDALFEDVTSEFVNNVLGAATTDFKISSRALHFSPPLIMRDVDQVTKDRRSRYLSAVLSAPDGDLVIDCILTDSDQLGSN